MKVRLVANVVLGTLLLAPAAWAGTINLISQTYTTDAGTSPSGFVDPNLVGMAGFGGGLLNGPILFDAPVPGTLTLSVTDLGLTGDAFQVLLDDASLGLTAPVTVGGPTSSAGVFMAALSVGDHTLDVWDFVQTYIGYDAIYSGVDYGAVGFAYQDGDVQVTAELVPAAAPIAEPAALAVLLPATLVLLRRRR